MTAPQEPGQQAQQTGEGQQAPPPEPPKDTHPAPPAADDYQARFESAERARREVTTKFQRMRDEFTRLQAELEGKSSVEQTLGSVQAEKARADRLVLAYRVSAEVGLPLSMAERLIGDDEEALREDARRLGEQLKPSTVGVARDSRVTPPNGDRTSGYSKEQLLKIMAHRD